MLIEPQGTPCCKIFLQSQVAEPVTPATHISQQPYSGRKQELLCFSQGCIAVLPKLCYFRRARVELEVARLVALARADQNEKAAD